MRIAEQFAFGSPDMSVRVLEQPDPGEPDADEVLIDTEFAPINPSDLLGLRGEYGAERPALPLVPGVEGVGRVARCGAGVTHVKPGDRVLLPGPGTWRERFLSPVRGLVALPEGVDPRQLAMLRVNPATAYLMLHEFAAPQPGHWVIQNAANSGVGQCLIRLARAAGVKSLNVVRRPELVTPLKACGADVVVVDGPDLGARVRDAVGAGTLRLAIDAVGGEATGRLASCVQDDGVVVNYGVMSGEPCRVQTRDIVFRNVTLRGFWLRRWFTVTAPSVIAATYAMLAEKMRAGELAVDVERDYPLRDIAAALAHAARPGRSGKILLSFADE